MHLCITPTKWVTMSSDQLGWRDDMVLCSSQSTMGVTLHALYSNIETTHEGLKLDHLNHYINTYNLCYNLTSQLVQNWDNNLIYPVLY